MVYFTTIYFVKLLKVILILIIRFPLIHSRRHSGVMSTRDNREAYNPVMTDKRVKLYEGDMALQPRQVNFAYGSTRMKDGGIFEHDYTWPGGNIYYVLSPSSEDNKEAILEAMHLWEKNTCITFTEVEEGAKKSHVIFKKLEGCWSYIGLLDENEGQDISIGRGCGIKGIIAHEIGHALGLWHEQSRPDRDTSVKVLFHNIENEDHIQFEVRKRLNNYGTPYDLRSIMHYGLQLFSKNGKNTIVPLNPKDNFVIGQREALSFYDVKQINLMYKCNEKCDKNLKCMNNGFITKKCVCRCPIGFSGTECEIEGEMPKPRCGGKSTEMGIFQTPQYPNTYYKGTKCVWIFKAPDDKRVRVKFIYFDLFHRDPETNICEYDALEIRDTSDYEGKMYCGQELFMKSKTFSREVAFFFSATHDRNVGFQAEITFV